MYHSDWRFLDGTKRQYKWTTSHSYYMYIYLYTIYNKKFLLFKRKIWLFIINIIQSYSDGLGIWFTS
jgi:hypothetical protein